jgi:hypothetical protein
MRMMCLAVVIVAVVPACGSAAGQHFATETYPDAGNGADDCGTTDFDGPYCAPPCQNIVGTEECWCPSDASDDANDAINMNDADACQAPCYLSPTHFACVCPDAGSTTLCCSVVASHPVLIACDANTQWTCDIAPNDPNESCTTAKCMVGQPCSVPGTDESGAVQPCQ